MVTAGQLLTYNINITQTSGFGPLVQLSVSGLPQGSTANFSEPGLSTPGTTRSIHSDRTTNAPVGTFHVEDHWERSQRNTNNRCHDDCNPWASAD